MLQRDKPTKCNINHCNMVIGAASTFGKYHFKGDASAEKEMSPCCYSTSPSAPMLMVTFSAAVKSTEDCHLVAFTPVITESFERLAVAFMKGHGQHDRRRPPLVQLQGESGPCQASPSLSLPTRRAEITTECHHCRSCTL